MSEVAKSIFVSLILHIWENTNHSLEKWFSSCIFLTQTLETNRRFSAFPLKPWKIILLYWRFYFDILNEITWLLLFNLLINQDVYLESVLFRDILLFFTRPLHHFSFMIPQNNWDMVKIVGIGFTRTKGLPIPIRNHTGHGAQHMVTKSLLKNVCLKHSNLRTFEDILYDHQK